MAQPNAPEDRLAELEDRIRANPDSRMFLQLADEYRRAERYDDALTTLREGLERQPGTVSAQVLLGRCLLESGDIRGAVTELRQVTDRDPTHPLAHKLLSQAQLADGDREAAGETLERYALLHSGDPDIPDLREALRGDAAQEPTDPPEPPVAPEAAAAEPSARSTSSADPFDLGPVASAAAQKPVTEGSDLFDLSPPIRPEVAPNEDLLGVWTPAAAESTAGAPIPIPDVSAADPGDTAAETVGDVFGDLITGRDRLRWEEGLTGGDVFATPAVDDLPPAPVAFKPPTQPVEPDLARSEPFPFEETPVEAPGLEAIQAIAEAEGPAAIAESLAEPAAKPESRPPTLTLGRLYLEQGHEDEARSIFESILERDPGHAGARQALQDLDRPPAPDEPFLAEPPVVEPPVAEPPDVEPTIVEPSTFAPASDAEPDSEPESSTAAPPVVEELFTETATAPDLVAADLEDPGDRHLGLTDRKVRVLSRYLDRIRKGVERHVP